MRHDQPAGKVAVLKNFAMQKSKGDPWLAPEVCPNILTGQVYGRDGFPDGANIETSVVKSVEGRIVTTSTGTIYKLVGPARKEFRQFLKDKGLKYDGKKPLECCRQYWENGGFGGGKKADENKPSSPPAA